LDNAFVRYWSRRYVEQLSPLERELLAKTRVAIAERGYLTADDLTKIAKWKSPRVLGVLDRDEKTIADVTRLSAIPEVLRVIPL
jgi:hypothetical protein